MNKQISLLAVAAAFSFVSTAQAQVPPAVFQNQNRIQLEQQRLMNEEFRRQELKNALKRPQAQETEKKSRIGLHPV